MKRRLPPLQDRNMVVIGYKLIKNNVKKNTMLMDVKSYMQKTCDVAEKAILAKKKCGKSAKIATKCKSRQKYVNRENQ